MADGTWCTATGDTPAGAGSVCLGDSDANGVDDACELFEAIPTVSTWGLVVLTLCLLVGLKIRFGRRQSLRA